MGLKIALKEVFKNNYFFVKSIDKAKNAMLYWVCNLKEETS